MEIDFTKTSAYYYDLPKELIAQDPAEQRDMSRLLFVDKSTGSTEQHIFKDITDLLRPGDLLVMNDTRVLPARLEGRKISHQAGPVQAAPDNTGGAHVEIFFLNPTSDIHKWKALVRPGRKLPEGTRVALAEGTGPVVTICDRLEDGVRIVVFDENSNPLDIIHTLGHIPLPHYITNTHAEDEQYQTVYNDKRKENSVAAPTAGLHFTLDLLKDLEERGIAHKFITLQVGLGTFRPVKAESIKDHIMHTEFCEISEETVQAVENTKKRGGRVIAVGTTVVRTLEAFAAEYGELRAGALNTRLFITPGYKFRVIDGLITNFHLPSSTLLMLVTAFGGYDNIMNAYKKAVRERFRFFSFGDSMLIL